MKQLVVAVDPGHGYKGKYANGAARNGLVEDDLVLKICNYLAEYLNNNGFIVKQTRKNKNYIPLNATRTPDCDISVSVHINAGGGRGIEVWHSLYNHAADSKLLADCVRKGILMKIPEFRDRGLKTKKSLFSKTDYLYMLRKPKGTPILVECGFIDNLFDAKILRDEAKLKLIAEGICRGLKDYRKILYPA